MGGFSEEAAVYLDSEDQFLDEVGLGVGDTHIGNIKAWSCFPVFILSNACFTLYLEGSKESEPSFDNNNEHF